MTHTKLQRAQALAGTSEGRPEDDFYPTPEKATRALMDYLTTRVKLTPIIWEPACGDGAISKVLHSYGYETYDTDKFDHGYGYPDMDFLDAKPIHKLMPDVITNPPFKYAQEFVRHALDLGANRVAILGKLQFLETQGRKPFFESTPLWKVLIFSYRLTLTRNGALYKNGGMIGFAWYIWNTSNRSLPTIEWL